MNDIKIKKLMGVERSMVNFYGNKTTKNIDNLYHHLTHSGYPDDHFGYTSFHEFLTSFFQDNITIEKQNVQLTKQYITNYQQGKTICAQIINQIENDMIKYLYHQSDVVLNDLENHLREHGYRYGDLFSFIQSNYKDRFIVETKVIDEQKIKTISLIQPINPIDLEKLIKLEKNIVNYYGHKDSISLDTLQTHLSHCGYPEDHYGFSSLKVFLKYYFKDVINIYDENISFQSQYIDNVQTTKTINVIEVIDNNISFSKKNQMKNTIGQSIIDEISPIILDCINHDNQEIETALQQQGYHYTNISSIITNYLYDQLTIKDNHVEIFDIDPFYQETIPCETSIDVLEHALNQIQNLFYQLENKEKPKDIKLNDFDRCLIETENAQNLYKYMNQPEIFDQGKKTLLRAD